ncbi:hypothetical protein Tco_0427206 [Tanacetum coccineum]
MHPLGGYKLDAPSWWFKKTTRTLYGFTLNQPWRWWRLLWLAAAGGGEMVVEVAVVVWQVVMMMMYGVDDRFGGDVDDGGGWRGSAGVAENITG